MTGRTWRRSRRQLALRIARRRQALGSARDLMQEVLVHGPATPEGLPKFKQFWQLMEKYSFSFNELGMTVREVGA